MLKLRMKQLLALFLCGLLVRPLPVVAEPAAAPGAVLGSVTSRGAVQVGDAQVPGMSALFSGDQVRTGVGSALIQYQDGARVMLGTESLASFSSARVELQKGQMAFATETGGPLFAAKTLRIEPVSAKSSANVTLGDHKATVAVTEGSLRVVDPSGVQLASLRAGEARLFEEVSAAAPGPAPPAAAAPPAPQIGGGTGASRTWLLALGIGIVGTSLGIAGLVRANDADDRADQSAADANAALATAAALRTQADALRAQVAALSAAAGTTREALASLATALSRLNAAQDQLNRLISDIAAQGGVATPAQVAQLRSLVATFQAIAREVNQAVISAGGVGSPTRLP